MAHILHEADLFWKLARVAADPSQDCEIRAVAVPGNNRGGSEAVIRWSPSSQLPARDYSEDFEMDTAALILGWALRWTCAGNTPVFGDKMPSTVFHHRAIRKVFPEVRFIICCRPLDDIIASHGRRPERERVHFPGRERIEQVVAAGEEVLADGHGLRVQHADLTRQPKPQIERMLSYLGLCGCDTCYNYEAALHQVHFASHLS